MTETISLGGCSRIENHSPVDRRENREREAIAAVPRKLRF